MLVFDIITAVPELLQSPFQHSILKRGVDRGLIQINIVELRPYGLGPHNQIDDYQYGGGAGMVMMAEPLDLCIQDLKSKNQYDEIIFMTPDGDTFNQQSANELSLHGRLMIILGHYKGIDQRIRDMHVTKEISIGDYVLSGGELAAAVLVDAVCRLVPGVMNDATSPSNYKGLEVPTVLLSGNDKLIDDWRMEQAEEKTKQRRPDLLED